MVWEASKRGDLDFFVAQPLGFDDAERTYTRAAVPGRHAVDDLYRPDGAAIAHKLGFACGSIPVSGLRVTHEHGPKDELERARRRASEVEQLVPTLRRRTTALVACLERLHSQLRPAPLRPIHGSPRPSDWLLSGGWVGLVDLDRASLGDPELDVATFTGEVDFAPFADRSVISSWFEEGYRECYGLLDERRLTVYRSHRHLAKVLRTVRSIHADGDERAEAHLERALDLVT